MSAGEEDSLDPDVARKIAFLLAESARLCRELGVSEKLLLDIYAEPTDWAFLIKIDALHETTCKAILRKRLILESGHSAGRNVLPDDFVDRLPLNGTTSIVSLVRAAGCPSELCEFIRAVRRIRNAYAHDIRNVDKQLLSLITEFSDSRKILKVIAPIEDGFDLSSYEELVAKDQKIVRFGILHETMRFLILAYWAVFKKELPVETSGGDSGAQEP